MHADLFILNLGISLGVVTLAMWYLRKTTRNVIRELCHTDAAAEFWLRTTDVLGYAGALSLVLMFGEFGRDAFVPSVRITLVLTLIGLFVTVLFASKSVWDLARANAAAKVPVKDDPWKP